MSSLWVSPLVGIWRCQKATPHLGSPAALHLLRPDLQSRRCVLHGTAGSLNPAMKLLLSALCVGGGGESREVKGAGLGIWVCAGKALGFVFLFCLLLVSQLSCVWLCDV